MRLARNISLLLWAALFFGACSSDTVPSGDRVKSVVIGLTSDFDTFQVLATANSDALHVIEEMLFLSLCELDSALQFQPRLAKTWQISPDGKQIRFTLRDDVVWSDGIPTTAHDVLFTYQLAIDPKVGYAARDRFSRVDNVQVLDDHTVVLSLTAPYPDALHDLNMPILPKHIFEQVAPEAIRQASFNRAPVSNGPFVLKSWRANDRVVFEANPDYYGGRPDIDQVVFRIIPDETVLLASVQSGGVDVLPYIAPNKVEPVRTRQHLRILTYPNRGYSFLAFNLQREIFADVRVRQAIAHAIDRRSLVEVLLGGYGRLVAGPIMPYFAASDTSLPLDTYNPQAAASMLDAAGWQDRDGDGVRERDGKPLSFSMKTNADNKLRSDALVMIQANLQQVGVRAQPEPVEFGKLVEDVIQKREFDTVLLSWTTGFTVNPAQIWHSDAITNGYNLPSYRSATVDSLLTAARNETDPATALQMWHAFQREIVSDTPYVFLFMQDNPAVVHERIRNVNMDVRGYLVNIEAWFIDEL